MNKHKKLEIKAALKVGKHAHDVFEAIVDPAKMSNYFISSGTGRIEPGKSWIWKFPEMDIEVPVRGAKVETDKFISFYWGDDAGGETLVEMMLDPRPDGSTFVVVTEKSKELDEKGLRWFASNTEGWANFLACLKAYLEYGINLRRNAFDDSQLPGKKE